MSLLASHPLLCAANAEEGLMLQLPDTSAAAGATSPPSISLVETAANNNDQTDESAAVVNGIEDQHIADALRLAIDTGRSLKEHSGGLAQDLHVQSEHLSTDYSK